MSALNHRRSLLNFLALLCAACAPNGSASTASSTNSAGTSASSTGSAASGTTGAATGGGSTSTSGSACGLGYAIAVLAETPLVYYPMDERTGVVMTDSSSHPLNGVYGSRVVLGQAGLVPSAPETAPRFPGGAEGPSAIAEVARSAQLEPGGALSVELFFEEDAVNAGSVVDLVSDGWSVQITPLNQLKLWLPTSAGNIQVMGSTAITPGAAHQVVATYDGSTAKLYLDGQLEGASLGSGAVIFGSVGLDVGASALWPARSVLGGKIAQVSVYGTALTVAQVLAHFRAAGLGAPSGCAGTTTTASSSSTSTSGASLGSTTSSTSSGATTTSSTSSATTASSTSSSSGGGSSIAAEAAACAAEPFRGTVYYYCDCGTGASAGCVAGNDANAGTSPSAPRRTLEDAVTRLNALSGTNTIAFCQGGAFNAVGANSITTAGCSAGTTCNDVREFSPTTFTGTAKPIINSASGGSTLFQVEGNVGGVRFLNIAINGNNPSTDNGNWGFFFYAGAHDVTMCNMDMSNFDRAVYNESNAGITSNIRVRGNNITNSYMTAYLGGGNGTDISYNIMEGNGATTQFSHAIYLASAGTGITVTATTVVGNYIHGHHSSGSTCVGTMFSNHGSLDGLLVQNNVVSIDAATATAGCWGIEFSNITQNAHPIYYRNAVFDGNTVINGGNLAFTVTSCPSCIISNNVIIQNWNSSGSRGIRVTYDVARPQDDVSNANHVINNTVWFGPDATGTSTGIWTDGEGVGHVIANNTVSSVQSSGTLNCYRHDLPLGSYAFMNNNHCYGTGSYNFEATYGTLAAWQAHATGFDLGSIEGAPAFVNTAASPYDFRPGTGSPLIGAGSSAQMPPADLTGKARPSAPAAPAIGAYEP